MAEQGQVLVSRPTFAELSQAIGKAGLSDLFDEDGNISFGELHIHTQDNVPQAARLAAAIADAAHECCDPELVYEDDKVTIRTKCRPDGVHVVEQRHGLDPHTVVVPRQALPLLSADLIECMGRHAE